MEKLANLTREAEQSRGPVERPPRGPLSESSNAVLALIERLAADPSADLEILQRMITIYERLKVKEAELAYNAAKGRILKKLARVKIVKTRPARCEIGIGRGQKNYEPFKFAPLEEIDKYLRPSWRKRTWTSPIPTSRKRVAAYSSAAV